MDTLVLRSLLAAHRDIFVLNLSKTTLNLQEIFIGGKILWD